MRLRKKSINTCKFRVFICCLFASLATVFWLRSTTSEDFDATESQPPYLTVFLLDGLNQQIFQEELALKNLPNIEKLISNGVYIKNGVTCFPSMTGYCYYALSTGFDSARSGMVGARWFSRGNHSGNFRAYFGGKTNAYVNHDTNTSTPTLFEAVNGWSWAGNSMFYRGVTIKKDTSLQNGLAKLRNKWWVPALLSYIPIVNHYFAPTFEEAEDLEMQYVLNGLDQVPKVQWCVFSSPDGCMHTNGFGIRYRQVLRNVDKLIGNYMLQSALKSHDSYRTYALVTDHGGANVTTNLDSASYLSRHGLRTYRGMARETDGNFERTLDFFADYDVTVLVNGDTMNHLYLKHPDYSGDNAWHHRVPLRYIEAYPLHNSKGTADLVEILLHFEGIELVVAYDHLSHAVYVHSTTGGKARITIDSSAKLLYEILNGMDPLEYCDGLHATEESRTIALSNIPHTESEWLHATHNTKFPYAVVRLFQVMSSPQGSDLVITAQYGYDLGKDYEMYIGSFDGGHGGLRYDQLRVPYVLSGYGIKKGVVMETARAEDIGATLMHLFADPHQKSPFRGKQNYDEPAPPVKPFMTFPQTPEFQDPIKSFEETHSELFQGRVLHEALL